MSPRVTACPLVSLRVSSNLAFNGTSPCSSPNVPISGYQEPRVRSVCVSDKRLCALVHWWLCGENINCQPSCAAPRPLLRYFPPKIENKTTKKWFSIFNLWLEGERQWAHLLCGLDRGRGGGRLGHCSYNILINLLFMAGTFHTVCLFRNLRRDCSSITWWRPGLEKCHLRAKQHRTDKWCQGLKVTLNESRNMSMIPKDNICQLVYLWSILRFKDSFYQEE